MNFKWRQTKDRNIFLSSPLPKLFWHVVGRLHQVIGLLHAIPSLLAFFHMNLCCLVFRVDFILKIPCFYISNYNRFIRYLKYTYQKMTTTWFLKYVILEQASKHWGLNDSHDHWQNICTIHWTRMQLMSKLYLFDFDLLFEKLWNLTQNCINFVRKQAFQFQFYISFSHQKDVIFIFWPLSNVHI